MISTQAVVLARPAATREGPWSSVRSLWPIPAVGLAYYLGCLAGFALRFPGSGISFFWPPTAVLTVALLIAAPRVWPTLVAASLVAHAIAHAQDGVPAGAWFIQFLGNAAQAVLAAALVRRYSRTEPLLGDTRTVLLFVGAGCVASPAAASWTRAFTSSLGWAPKFVNAWVARSVSNAVASIVLVPALLAACQFLASRPVRIPDRLAEFALLLVGVAALHSATVYFARADLLGLSVAIYAPTPFLIWAIVRFRLQGLSFALLWTTLLAMSIASAGLGPLFTGAAATGVLGVQVFVAAEAVVMMIIGGLLEEKRVEHARLLEVADENNAILSRLRHAQHRYELATASVAVGVWDLDLETGELHIDGQLRTLLGYDEHEIENTVAGWMRLVGRRISASFNRVSTR